MLLNFVGPLGLTSIYIIFLSLSSGTQLSFTPQSSNYCNIFVAHPGLLLMFTLSKYCERIREKFGITIGQVEKLVPKLSNKEKYVLHYRNLQYYIYVSD